MKVLRFIAIPILAFLELILKVLAFAVFLALGSAAATTAFVIMVSASYATIQGIIYLLS